MAVLKWAAWGLAMAAVAAIAVSTATRGLAELADQGGLDWVGPLTDRFYRPV